MFLSILGSQLLLAQRRLGRFHSPLSFVRVQEWTSGSKTTSVCVNASSERPPWEIESTERLR
jgi:hypothetical protein